MYYVLSIVTVFALLFVLSLKEVSLDGTTLIIRGLRKEARIPLSMVDRIRPFGRCITIIFKSRTAFGRAVSFMPGRFERDQVTKKLRAAMEGKNAGAKINRTPHNSVSVPSTTAQKEIIVSGWDDEELSGILSDFADTSDDSLPPNFDYQVQPCDKGATRITFPHDIPADIFLFLVNYIQYPKNYDLETRSISVVGKVVLTPDFYPPDKNLIGQKASFYVPSNDQDYDLVYVRVGGETFVNSFALRHWKKATDPRIPAGLEV
jgi:hypothetical protein